MGILDNDVLVIDQVTSFMSNDFAIRDAQGQQVGHIHTEGGALQRMFLGSRSLSIVEADGQLLMGIEDPPNFGRDTYDLLGADGQRFGEVVKQFTFFSKHLTVQLAQDTLELRGSFMEREFSVDSQYGEAARVSRRWPAIQAMFLGKERYVLGFAPQLPHAQRVGTLGAVVALDLIRHKEQQAASSSS